MELWTKLGLKESTPLLMSLLAHPVIVIWLVLLSFGLGVDCRADSGPVERGAVFPAPPVELARPHSEWRNVLRAEFKYTTAIPADPAGALPLPAAPALELSVASEIVVLPRFVVHEDTSSLRALDKDIRAGVASATEAAKQETVGKKLGIGLHEFKFKHVSFGCFTIFYIPIAAGMSW